MDITKDLEKDNEMKEQFLEILSRKQITSVFQPIVSLRDGSVYGYEALSRGPQNTRMHSPGMLFDCAEKYGKIWELELLCRTKAIETVYHLHEQLGNFRLFMNVHPQVIRDSKFERGFTKEYLSQYGMGSENIIFEITERGAISNISDFISIINNYKSQNYKIAIDDAGAGYSGLNMITDIHPHFIKLDMNLIRNIDKDVTKQLLIKSFTDFASLTNTYIVAEGIENKNELLKLIDIGVHFGQGFYLKEPDPCIVPVDSDIIYTIHDANKKKNHLLEKRASDIFICNITANQKGTNPKILITQVFDTMQKDMTIPGVCVTEDDFVLGIVTRSDLYRRLSGQYGYNLYIRKPIESIMSAHFLQVDYHESIETVAKKAMGRRFDNLYDFITVTKDGRYFGIVTVKDLLEKSYQVELNNAKHLNPLSELPGNMLIEKKLEECINSPLEYSILYFDINNFKAYNDTYGFENGDRFLKCMTKILKGNISQERNFLGHIGGDDFVAILQEEDAAALCKRIIHEFDEAAPLYYNKNDLERGYITSINRHGIEEDFPILSVSIVVISSKKYRTIYSLSESLARLKKTCKQNLGSSYLVE